MDAFTVARDILGEMELSAEQLAQLRAVNHDYSQRLFALLHSPTAEASAPEDVSAAPPRSARELTEAEVAELRRALEADVLSLLTPEQRQLLEQR